MTSNTTASHDPSELGELERSILSVVWRKTQITAEQVREESWGRPLKGLHHPYGPQAPGREGLRPALGSENRTFIYRPAESMEPCCRAGCERASWIGSAMARWKHCWWVWSIRKFLIGPSCSGLLSASPRRRTVWGIRKKPCGGRREQQNDHGFFSFAH